MQRLAPTTPSADDGAMDMPFPPGHARRIALLALSGFVAIAALVLTGETGALDPAGLLAWRHGPALAPVGPHWLTRLFEGLTLLGDVVPRSLAALFAAGWLFLRQRRGAALWLVATVASGWTMNSALKWLIARPRPIVVPHLDSAGGPSFPSGHSFNGAVVWLAVALAIGLLVTKRATRAGLLAGAVALSLAIPFSRVWLGVHYPSDVMAGWFGGVAWVFGAVWLSGSRKGATMRG